jgi:hypothetical protein
MRRVSAVAASGGVPMRSLLVVTLFARFDTRHLQGSRFKSSQKYLKFSDQAIWLSLSVG